MHTGSYFHLRLSFFIILAPGISEKGVAVPGDEVSQIPLPAVGAWG